MTEFKKILARSLKLISTRDKIKLYQSVPISISLSFLDLLGVVLLGTVTTLTFNSVSSNENPTRLEVVISSLLPNNLTPNTLIIVLSIISVICLLLKTLLQGLYFYRLGKFLARIESHVAYRLYESILNSRVSKINKFDYSQYQYVLTTGVNQTVQGIIGNSFILFADFSTAIMMFAFAFYASPITTLSVVLVFLSAYYLFNVNLGKRAIKLGTLSQETQVKLNDVIGQSVSGIREIQAYKFQNEFISRFATAKRDSTFVGQQKLWVLGSIRYILELAIVISGVIAAFVLILSSNLRHSITLTTVFVLIGFRLLPIIQRIQNSITSIGIAKNATSLNFEFLDIFKEEVSEKNDVSESNLEGTLSRIELKNVFFSHDNAEQTISDISLEIWPLQTTVILGESGSGKSTLIDLITGACEPSNGEISYVLSSHPKILRPGQYPFSYISQACALFGENVYQSVSLKQEVVFSEKLKIDTLINSLNLSNLIMETEEGMRKVRNDSSNISGGERQRLAIARAQYFESDLLILDEPTSSLDPENRAVVLEYIKSVSKKKTILIVTHDEAFLNLADQIAVLAHGELVFKGSREIYERTYLAN